MSEPRKIALKPHPIYTIGVVLLFVTALLNFTMSPHDHTPAKPEIITDSIRAAGNVPRSELLTNDTLGLSIEKANQ